MYAYNAFTLQSSDTQYATNSDADHHKFLYYVRTKVFRTIH